MTRLSSSEARKLATEHEIQVAIIRYLERVLPKTVRAIAVSNNPRSKITGAREKARGMKAGFPDILLIGGTFVGLIEVKKEGGKLSGVQKDWRDWFAAHLIPYAVCRSIEDVQDTLRHWGLSK